MMAKGAALLLLLCCVSGASAGLLNLPVRSDRKPFYRRAESSANPESETAPGAAYQRQTPRFGLSRPSATGYEPPQASGSSGRHTGPSSSRSRLALPVNPHRRPTAPMVHQPYSGRIPSAADMAGQQAGVAGARSAMGGAAMGAMAGFAAGNAVNSRPQPREEITPEVKAKAENEIVNALGNLNEIEQEFKADKEMRAEMKRHEKEAGGEIEDDESERESKLSSFGNKVRGQDMMRGMAGRTRTEASEEEKEAREDAKEEKEDKEEEDEAKSTKEKVETVKKVASQLDALPRSDKERLDEQVSDLWKKSEKVKKELGEEAQKPKASVSKDADEEDEKDSKKSEGESEKKSEKKSEEKAEEKSEKKSEEKVCGSSTSKPKPEP